MRGRREPADTGRIGATEDEAARRAARPGGTRLHSETCSKDSDAERRKQCRKQCRKPPAGAGPGAVEKPLQEPCKGGAGADRDNRCNGHTRVRDCLVEGQLVPRDAGSGEREAPERHAPFPEASGCALDCPLAPESVERCRICWESENLLDEAILDPKQQHLIELETASVSLAVRVVQRGCPIVRGQDVDQR